jgi:hypothetical protein
LKTEATATTPSDNGTEIRAVGGVLAPFVMPSVSQMMRKWLMENAVRYFRPMFKPPIPPKTVIEAQLALYSGDEDELLRLTWAAVGRGWTPPEATQYLIP